MPTVRALRKPITAAKSIRMRRICEALLTATARIARNIAGRNRWE
jgi:hypothetical protein